MLSNNVETGEDGVGIAIPKQNEVWLFGFVSYLENWWLAKVWGVWVEYGIAVVSFYGIKFFGIGANPVAFWGELPVFVVGAGVFPHGVDFDVDVVFESIGALDCDGECHGECPKECDQ